MSKKIFHAHSITLLETDLLKKGVPKSLTLGTPFFRKRVGNIVAVYLF
jgi:hypothetical protein